MGAPVPNNELAFEAALQNSGNVDVFLDDFFNFLSRRTDFFTVCPPEGGPVGFLEGHAESMLLTKFKKWQSQSIPCKVPGPSTSTSDRKAPPGGQGQSKPKPLEVKPKATTRAQLIGSDTYNGCSTDKYSWAQTITDLDLKIFVKPEVKKGKEVTVEIKSDSLSVKVHSEILLEGRFPFSIVKDDSYWSLVPGEAVHISLQKTQERWWTSLLEGETQIDMTQIEAEKPMEDLSEEEQMKIQELMWQEEQKRKGLPVPGRSETEDLLKKAWNSEGSPFQGQPFDPSIVNFNN